MGEIMRWRLTRSPQRRMPGNGSILQVENGSKISSASSEKLSTLTNNQDSEPRGQQKGRKSNAKLSDRAVAYLSVLQDVNDLRLHLTTGIPKGPDPVVTPAIQDAAKALLELDDVSILFHY